MARLKIHHKIAHLVPEGVQVVDGRIVGLTRAQARHVRRLAMDQAWRVGLVRRVPLACGCCLGLQIG